MPCDTIQTTRITLEGMKIEQVRSALEELGWTVTGGDVRTTRAHRTVSVSEGLIFHKGYQRGVFKDGRMTIQNGVDALSEVDLKQAYGRTVVKEQAKRAGWMVQQDKQNPNKMQMMRRF